MNKNNTEYSIYGLNNAISILSSTKYLNNDFIIMKGGFADIDSKINKFVQKSTKTNS